jgi:ABC-type cobalamin transport system ATPase subunit
MSSHDLNHTLRHAGQSWLLCQGSHRLRRTAEVLNEENLTAAYAIPFQRGGGRSYYAHRVTVARSYLVTILINKLNYCDKETRDRGII